MSLKLRLSIGAALLGAGSILTAAILWLGLSAVAERLDAALASENRIARYAALSTQAATFFVVSTEAVQTGLPADLRMTRIAPLAGQLKSTFALMHDDVAAAVEKARTLGLDEQSRLATQSLGLARMEALLDGTIAGLAQDIDDRDRLRAHIDSFVAGFDPLLGEAVGTEQRFRQRILGSIDALRERLIRIATLVAIATVASLAAFYFGLVRPQFRRLDALRGAADQIGAGRFGVDLPVGRMDEIGQLSERTNRMAAALKARETDVEAEWARLNETIAARTEELQRANATLAEIDNNRRRFFADISHELRTPLTVILMEAEIGRHSVPQAAPAFATIEARATRLTRRIDDLLRLARSESGQLALDRQPTPLGALVAAIHEEVASEVQAAGMTLEVADMPDVVLLADTNWLRQVVVGLVRNAIRYARDGKTMRIAPVMQDMKAGLRLIDNGPGIPDTEQEHVFERFAQGDAAYPEGFGVGLALAAWVIHAQNGKIDLQSPVPAALSLGDGPGLAVTVRVPLLAPNPRNETAAASTPRLES